jgi:hypothetical protein
VTINWHPLASFSIKLGTGGNHVKILLSLDKMGASKIKSAKARVNMSQNQQGLEEYCFPNSWIDCIKWII